MTPRRSSARQRPPSDSLSPPPELTVTALKTEVVETVIPNGASDGKRTPKKGKGRAVKEEVTSVRVESVEADVQEGSSKKRRAKLPASALGNAVGHADDADLTPSKKRAKKVKANEEPGDVVEDTPKKRAKNAESAAQPNGHSNSTASGSKEAAETEAAKGKAEDKPTKRPRKAVKSEGADEDGPAPPKKPKGKPWPPPTLDPSLHPPRSGFPAYPFSPDTRLPHFVGAHCSIAGGAAGALLRAGLSGFNGVALFVKNQKQWKSPPMEAESIERFKQLMAGTESGGLDYPAERILVHGSYLINLGNPDPAKWNLSYDCFRDDIERCYQLGIRLYNWHPGSTVGACSREEGCANIARAVNRVHKEVPEVVTVIENMANAKSNVIGTTFADLASIISLVEDKSRVRVCLDTCHLFAAGYDIRTPEAYAETMAKFEAEVGLAYLAGMHLNDSKTDFGSCKDLHENIGLGFIGLSAFRSIMRDPRLCGIPMILETPQNPSDNGEALILEAMETKMLYEIQQIGDDDWEEKKLEIEKRWRADRDRLNPPKEKGPKAPKPKKNKKKKEEEGCESHDEDD